MHGMRFSRKRAKKKRGKKYLKREKKGQNIWKYGQKCTKLENILKKGRWLHGIIAHNKLLEQALPELTPLAKTFCRSAVDRNDLKTY